MLELKVAPSPEAVYSKSHNAHLLQCSAPHIMNKVAWHRTFNCHAVTKTLLLNLKINSITKCLLQNVDPSLYVDDFLISYRSKKSKLN